MSSAGLRSRLPCGSFVRVIKERDTFLARCIESIIEGGRLRRGGGGGGGGGGAEGWGSRGQANGN